MAILQNMGRLAFREEGVNWCAYYALADTLDDAIFLGSISMRLATKKQRRNEFMALMKNCFSDLVQETVGVRPVWRKPVRAPEHERSKNA